MVTQMMLSLPPCLSYSIRGNYATRTAHAHAESMLVLGCRDGFTRAFDAYCGLCITGLYFLYLSVVKGALSVFDCTMNKDGVYILDADPSIVCSQVCKKSTVVHIVFCHG